MNLSLFCTIPSILVTNKNLDPKACLLFGVIAGLTQNEFGYCWAGNAYFAEIFDVDERTIRRWLQNLKEEKVIKIQILKDGIKTSRRIWICLDFSKIYSSGHNCPSQADIFVHRGTPRPYINNINTKNKYIAQQAAPAVAEAPAIPSFSKKRKKVPEEYFEVAERVMLTQTQKASLLKKAGNEETYEKWINRLSIWKIDNCVEDGSDFHCIFKWVISAVKSDEAKLVMKTNLAESTIRKDQMLAEKIWNQCKVRPEKDIVLSGKYIEFIQGVNSPSILLEFGSKDFKEKCYEQLRKRKITLEEKFRNTN